MKPYEFGTKYMINKPKGSNTEKVNLFFPNGSMDIFRIARVVVDLQHQYNLPVQAFLGNRTVEVPTAICTVDAVVDKLFPRERDS